jgi:hypothetical protein
MLVSILDDDIAYVVSCSQHRYAESPQLDIIQNYSSQISEPEEFGLSKDLKKLFVHFFGTQQM